MLCPPDCRFSFAAFSASAALPRCQLLSVYLSFRTIVPLTILLYALLFQIARRNIAQMFFNKSVCFARKYIFLAFKLTKENNCAIIDKKGGVYHGN